jgi:hypothetical protein
MMLSYLAWLAASAGSISGVQNAPKHGRPSSNHLILPFKRGISAIFLFLPN